MRYYGIKPAYVKLLQKLCKQQEGTVLTDKESEVFLIKKGTKQGDPLSSLLFNTVLQYSLENNLTKWQENKKGIRLSDKTEDCLTNLRFADDVLLISTSLGKLRDMLCDFKASTEASGSGDSPRQDEDTQQSRQRKRKGDLSRQHQEVSWTKNHVRRSGNRGCQKQTEGCVGSVPQVSTGADLKGIPTVSQTSPAQHGHHSYDDLCKWHMDSHAKARKNDQDSATKDASPHNTDEKKGTRRKAKLQATKKTRCPVKQRRKTKNIYLIKKLKTNRRKNQTKTRTAMYLFKKKRTKKLMPPITKKNWSSSSNEVQRMPKNA